SVGSSPSAMGSGRKVTDAPPAPWLGALLVSLSRLSPNMSLTFPSHDERCPATSYDAVRVWHMSQRSESHEPVRTREYVEITMLRAEPNRGEYGHKRHAESTSEAPPSRL